MSLLFSPVTLRSVTVPNRIFVSPMCQYSADDGIPDNWHLVHLGSRAVGGAGLVLTEATSVSAVGRISPQDLGIWKDDHIENLARVTRFVREHGAAPGIQLAHAGRKASTYTPWMGDGPLTEGAWTTVAPSAIPFDEGYPTPQELAVEEIRQVIADFAAAARRALAAGFDVIELHAAHGYLGHQFNSPLSNRRTDAYGGSFDNRTRFVREMVAAVRKEWPERLPLMVRVSATDWVEGGWDGAQTVVLAKELKALGVDCIDCSTGGLLPRVKISVGPGYQVPFARQVRSETGIATGAVGLITDPEQAQAVIDDGAADLVLLAREFLRDPYWPLHAAHALGEDVHWPVQYSRAKPRP